MLGLRSRWFWSFLPDIRLSPKHLSLGLQCSPLTPTKPAMRDETPEQPAPLRSGYTTGSCATATSLAAARLGRRLMRLK